jgi:hypothetical protein
MHSFGWIHSSVSLNGFQGNWTNWMLCIHFHIAIFNKPMGSQSHPKLGLSVFFDLVSFSPSLAWIILWHAL